MKDHQGLADRIAGAVLVPGDEGYDAERSGFQLHGQHRPDVIVAAAGAEDVREAVASAAAHGTPIAVQATGHGLPRGADGGMLITTGRMDGVRIDAAARTARVEAGVRWGAVVAAAADHGLAPVNGSSPTVGAVSYTLGGGVGLLSRRFGFASDHVRSIDVVTADGAFRHVTAESDPDLFWALRGGRANFGVVTALEFDLVPVERIHGGGLYFDTGHIPAVLDAYREWTATVPEEMTSSVALVPFPDAPGVPEPLRGRYAAHVRIIHAGDSATGERLVEPLRAVAPRLIDTVRDMPYAECATIHAEPPFPMAYHSAHALVGELDPAIVAAALDAGERFIVEIRHLGGAMSRPPATPSAVGHRDARYLAAVLSPILPGHGPEASRPGHEAFIGALAPWDLGRSVNFLYGDNATEAEVRRAYEPADHERLVALKAKLDPSDLFRLNHHIA
ncbi:FAD-binding oxidoreductase [Actinomadura kijaniata]|uniref:FAD/FMN-containing dehydrogenase n=1 Tax=Actinomadura namibiensis TaxID=182080 RepID=A0A7W3LLT6_ACTNM|nr:FAD-binding oxidoreductase [Actinomadura namibiensis]MBA8950400.1 FAD/FMN-containing dehydrogenase [Actinomadura namibiensis]